MTELRLEGVQRPPGRKRQSRSKIERQAQKDWRAPSQEAGEEPGQEGPMLSHAGVWI